MVGADLSTDLSTIGDFPLPVRLALIAGTSSCHMAVSDAVYLVGQFQFVTNNSVCIAY